jgi:hypothetical protein
MSLCDRINNQFCFEVACATSEWFARDHNPLWSWSHMSAHPDLRPIEAAKDKGAEKKTKEDKAAVKAIVSNRLGSLFEHTI